MSDMTSGLRIGQVAERTGLSIHTLRLYEREGLLVGPVRRLPNGHRVYGEWDVEWLSVCAKFRASGMPLADIRRYAELLRRGPGTEAERLRLLREHREALLRRIAELTACLDLITHKVEVYEQHLARGAAGEPWADGVPAAAVE